MNQNASIYILIPAYNEAGAITGVIKGLQSHGYTNILVVNDGSKDDTAAVAKSAGAEVLNHIINRGQGAALRTGIEYIREQYNPDAIVTFDADGQHDINDLPAMLEPILSGACDITIGSRFLGVKADVPPIRKLILKAGVIFTNAISNINLTDTHNGYRVLGKKAICEIKITHRGWEHASDIIDEISKNKLRYKEIPVKINYTDYSKNKPARQQTTNFIKMGIKIIFNKITH